MYKVPLASSGLTNEAITASVEVLNSGKLTMGRKVGEFEHAMAAYLGVKHFVMVNSGSSANLLMVEALVRPTNLRPFVQSGAKVAVPAIAWPTTIWPLVQLGLAPHFVDVDPSTLAIDPDLLERDLRNGEDIKAIFVINALGLPSDEDRLDEIARRFGIPLIVDNCESLGSRVGSRHSGTDAIMSSYSFYFSHHMTTMEGGGIATDSPDIADDLRAMRSHGWSRDRSDAEGWAKLGRPEDSKFLFVSTGYNVRPMEIQAAIGLTEIKMLEKYVQRRIEIAELIELSLNESPLTLLGASDWRNRVPIKRHSWMMLPVLVSEDSKISRSTAISLLNESGVETRPILTGNFLSQPAIRRLFPDSPSPDNFPAAEKVSANGFMVGCHQDFSPAQVEHLVASFDRLGKAARG